MTLKQLGITTIGKVVQISVYLTVGAALVVCTALAAQIDTPHQFAPGTPARAGEVNANFAALADESNALDIRLTALEGRTVSAQMICRSEFFYHTGTWRCVRSTTPIVQDELSLAEIFAEGWTADSIGGDGSGNAVAIFNQYETT